MTEAVRLWRIGESSEVYAAHSEEQVKAYMTKILGEEEARGCIADLFEEIPESDFDIELPWTDENGIKSKSTWRRQIAEYKTIPCQISTGYI